MKRVNKRGVSLAELLAVVVIMGIIAAIAIPLVGNVIENAKKKAFLGDLVTVTEAARTYCTAQGEQEGNGICKLTAKDTVESKGNGKFILNTAGSEAASLEASAYQVTDASDVNFAKYLSKPISQISDKVFVICYKDKYYIAVTSIGPSGYRTFWDSNAGYSDGNDATSLFIDPTYPGALDYITNSTSSSVL